MPEAGSNMPVPFLSLRGDGHALTISVVGYQYPNETAYPDSEWLILEVSGEYAGKTWTRRDPAIIAHDLKHIASWFKALHAGITLPVNPMGFWEQNLAFHHRGETPDLKHRVDIWLDYEFKPPGFHATPGEQQECLLSFELSRSEILAVADATQEAARRFPVRDRGTSH
jgi:hypothetical protein